MNMNNTDNTKGFFKLYFNSFTKQATNSCYKFLLLQPASSKWSYNTKYLPTPIGRSYNPLSASYNLCGFNESFFIHFQTRIINANSKNKLICPFTHLLRHLQQSLITGKSTITPTTSIHLNLHAAKKCFIFLQNSLNNSTYKEYGFIILAFVPFS